MPPRTLKLRFSRTFLPPFSNVTAPAPLIDATLNENACGEPMCGFPSRLKRMRSIALRVGRGADGRARVGAHPLLVDDDRRRQPVEHVDVGPRQRRHEALHERAVRLVDQPLRLGRDRAEHERALARARHAGERGQPALRELDADVLQVVDPRAGARGSGRGCRQPGGAASREPASHSLFFAGARFLAGGIGQRTSLMRSRLPAGSRTAQSRTP